MSEYTELELLNGWEAVEGFRPPEYRKSDGWVSLRGSATGPHGVAIAYIGPEYKGKITYPSLYGLGYRETWVIKDDGYLYFEGVK